MTFKIHAVYKQASKVQQPPAKEVSNDEAKTDDVKELSLSSSTSSTQNKPTKSLEQQRADILNSRNVVKPGTKSAIRKSAYEGGYESDMY